MIEFLQWYIRKFPVRTGKVPLIRAADKLGLLRNIDRVGVFGDGIKARFHLDDWVQQLVYFFGVYEFEKAETAAWIRAASCSKSVLDIGANFGYYSLLARKANSDCSIFAFEPAPETFARLKGNVEMNGFSDSIRLFNYAVSNVPGKLPLYLATDDNSGMTSLSKPESFSGRVVDVDIVVMDRFLEELIMPQVDLVKIDVEGNEYNVLLGMNEILRISKPVLFIELLDAHLNRFSNSVAEVFGYLGKLNYRCYEINKKGVAEIIDKPKDIGLAIFIPEGSEKTFIFNQ